MIKKPFYYESTRYFCQHPEATKFSENTSQEFESTSSKSSDHFVHKYTPISNVEKIFLATGSAIGALYNPHRADLVATLGETTGEQALIRIQKQMQEHPVGQQILQEKPIISESSLSLSSLENYPSNSLGKMYYDWMKEREFSPDERPAVQFLEDPELAYIMTRYRQSHDFLHTIFNLPSDVFSEIALKWFELVQTQLPMCGFSAIFGPIPLGPRNQIVIAKDVLPWALKHSTSPHLPQLGQLPLPSQLLQFLPFRSFSTHRSEFFMNIYWEKHLSEDIDELRHRFNYSLPTF